LAKHQFRHLRHLDGARQIQAYAGADHDRADDPRYARRRHMRPEHSRQDGNGHADDAVQIATARSLGIAQTAEAQDEENGCSDIGDCR